MPGHLRTRLRRALIRSTENGAPRSKFRLRGAKLPSDFYQPGEPMPPLKYRRPVEPEHKKRLEAFSFDTAWRCRSQVSLYSPMASRLPSRKASFCSRRSCGRKSRTSSFSSDFDHQEWIDSGLGASIADDHHGRPANIREASEDEGDVLNVGLSRNPTEDPRDARRKPCLDNHLAPEHKPSLIQDASSAHACQLSQLKSALIQSSIGTPSQNSEATLVEGVDDPDDLDDLDDFDDPNLRPRGGSIYLPYDGKGTPPELPVWENVFDSWDDLPSPRHFSLQPLASASTDDTWVQRRDEQHDSVVSSSARASGLVAKRPVPAFVPPKASYDCPSAQPASQKLPPGAPCAAIAAILARPN